MSNFNLRPIPKEIRYKLLQKQKAFARQSITEPTSANKSLELGDDFLQFHNRSTWAHMIGLTVIPGEDEKERIAIIGAGELNQEPAANEPLMKSHFSSIYRPWNLSKGAQGEAIFSDTLYRPISGIKSISTRYEGDIKSRRECTVNFTVFSLEDLDRLSPYFFRVGSEVLVEFGWNVVTNKDTSMFNTSLGHKIIDIYNKSGVSGFNNDSGVIDLLKENTAENYETEILKHSGDYEYVLGQISNFEYSLRDDGGFDCVVKIQTVGMSLIDTKVDRQYSPSAISAPNEKGEREIEFSSPDEVSDEFYLMMHNLPEIVYGSLIQGYSASDPDAPSTREKVQGIRSNFGDGIDARDAAWGLMGGWQSGMPTVPEVKSNNQEFVVAFLSATLAHGVSFWTKYKPLVAVFQEALMEQGLANPNQGYDLPNSGPDGDYGPETATAADSFYKQKGKDIFNRYFRELELDKKGEQLSPDETGYDPWFHDRKYMLRILSTKGRSEYFYDGGVGQEVQRNYGSEYSKLSTKFLETGGEKFGLGHDSRRKQYSINETQLYLKEDERLADIDKKIVTPTIESKFYKGKVPYKESSKYVLSDKNITIFTSYKQGNTTQIFTGFNWSETKANYDTLSEKYAGETYRDDFIVRGIERDQARIAHQQHYETQAFGFLEWTHHFDDWSDWLPGVLKPRWASVPRGKDAEIKYQASKLKDPSKTVVLEGGTDEFLEHVEMSVPPQTWIRWGWFEDNILTRYLGYMPDVDAGGNPVSLFKSVEPKIDMGTGKIISGYESNKIGLPEALKTTDVKQIIIPDRVQSLENVTNTAPVDHNPEEDTTWGTVENTKWDYNFYASLGAFLNSEIKGSEGVGISPVEKPAGKNTDNKENYKVGYIRNLFVEASTLQRAFLNIGTLKEGLDRFILIMYKNFGNIHKLEVQQGRDDNMVGIVDTNLISDNAIWKNKRKEDIPDSLENEADKIRVFEFPAWEKESIVKSQDLKVSIPNEMAITALYSANEHMRNFGLYDESRGSVEAQKLSKYLRLDDKGKDISKKSISNRLSELSPIITSKNLTISGDGENETGKHRYTEPDTFLTLLNNELLRSIGKNPISAETIELDVTPGTEEDSTALASRLNKGILQMKKSFLNDGGSYYNNKGTLKEDDPYNMRRIMEYELNYHTNAVQTNYPTINGLLDLSLTIDGTAGIFPGNSYISKYLPKAWQARTTGKGAGEYPILFQATDVSHDISSDGWNTMISGMPRMNHNAFPYVTAEIDTDGDIEIIKRPASEAISKYFNFFNLNYNFAKFCLTGDSAILEGINTNLWTNDISGIEHDTKERQIGSFKDMGMTQAIEKLEWLGKEESAMRLNEFEGGTATTYANFKKVKESLNFEGDEGSIIPGKTVTQTSKKGRGSTVHKNPFKIPSKTFKSNEELLLFLQMSMIISGLTHYGISGLSIDKAFYNKMLADTNFESNRPKSLRKVGHTDISRLISKSEIGKDKKLASEVYFTSVPMTWAKNVTVSDTTISSNNGLDFYWYTQSISNRPEGTHYPTDMFIWQKKEHYDEDVVNRSDVPTGVLLIGPARFNPPVDYWTQTQPPINSELKLLENVFKTILKNEYGIGTWREFDKIISDATGLRQRAIDSEKVFKYALDCEYRIKKPS